MNTKWVQFEPNPAITPNASAAFQKEIRLTEINSVYLNIYQYMVEEKNHTYNLYESHIQLQEDLSITGKTVNIHSFTYEKLDFDLIEQDALMLIRGLTV